MIDVVGIGAAGPDAAARALIEQADVVIGAPRHLDLVGPLRGETHELPSPLRAGLCELIGQDPETERRVAVLASGDPLVAGVGTTLIDLFGPDRVRIHPAVSSVALARARMGWAAESVEIVRLGTPDQIRRFVAPNARIIVLSADETSPVAIAMTLIEAGAGDTTLTVLGDLGTEHESRTTATARELLESTMECPRLNVVCVQVSGADAAGVLAPGLDDDAFHHDGQITKRHIRASALAALAPKPGELLWDLGAGSGSIGIEWARCHRSLRTIAVEKRPERAERIALNAAALGVPGQVEVHIGSSREALAPLSEPDAIFIGGGLDADLVEACWQRLTIGGRLVVHAVTLETESLLIDLQDRRGGDLAQFHAQTLERLGRFRAWQPSRPVVQWCVTKTSQEDQ